MGLVVRSYYSVDRPSAKFRRIRSPSDSPTVNCIAVPLPVSSSDVSASETVAGLHFFPLLSAQPPLHSPSTLLPNPPCVRNRPIEIGGLQKPPKNQTLANPKLILLLPAASHTWPLTHSTLASHRTRRGRPPHSTLTNNLQPDPTPRTLQASAARPSLVSSTRTFSLAPPRSSPSIDPA